MGDQNIEEICKLANLSVSEESVIPIPDGAWQENKVNLESCLVGQILSLRQTHLESFQRTMVGAWQLSGDVSIKKVNDRAMLFQFSQAADRNKVMGAVLGRSIETL